METQPTLVGTGDQPTAETQEGTAALQGAALVEATWEELGFKIRPMGSRIYVRTDTPPRKIGSLYIPPEQWGMYGKRLGSKVFVTATVLARGSRASFSPDVGERVVFSRLQFGWTHKMNDGTFVGWVDAGELKARERRLPCT
jgi:hypothetical protein